ncbi:CinA family protein [Leifsonia sp. NPDC058292]|uniref:CinA family protein n=1 Tax=Leifsonia sp. NPDC058292 TaxID=3346428 RepID=UPI0036DBABBF
MGEASRDAKIAQRIADLAGKDTTVGVAESLTSGALASALGAAPNASEWFCGAVVAYSERVKFDVLGVTPGPVITADCAREMAEGALRLLGCDVVAAVTGAGGPGPQEGKAAGTVHLAHGRTGQVQVDELHFDGEPAEVVQQTVTAALTVIAEALAR